ncbi:MAG: outer membrane protein assembly factor BamD [Bacteroidia bacterium]|nr:outer membrane protein assembly factor BamD [Bacteroidia bacterium]
MRGIFHILISSLVCMVILTSCSKEYKKYSQWSRKGTVSEKDSAAFYFYRQGDYEKAAFLFEDLRGTYRGAERAKTVLYHYAYSKYNGGYYIIAAHYFEQYVQLYPTDSLAEECNFMIAYCYYLESDPSFLDQGFTTKAITQFQLFINSYPFSDKVDKSNELMASLRERLAKKEYDTAELYFNVENYKAAVTAYEVFIQEFPDSRYREQAQFMIVKASVLLADVSTDRKKKNRYLDAIEWYERFVDKYPNSPYLKEAETLYVRAKKNLGKVMASENES